MHDILKTFATQTKITACSVGVVRENGSTENWNWGEASSQSLFDCASLTKVWPTNELISLGVHSGLLQKDRTLEWYLPQWKGSPAGQRTLGELYEFAVEWKITLSQQKQSNAEDLLAKLQTANTNLSSTPIYANATSIVLGQILEHVHGERLDRLAQQLLFTPLKLQRTGFFPKEIDANNIIPTEIDSWRGRELRGEVHDESAWILQQSGVIPGSAGLFSCLDDLLQLAQWQLQESPSRGEGWELRSADWMGHRPSPRAYGKTGFTGCSALIDPQKKYAVIILSNFTYPHRPENRQPLENFRRCVHDFLLA